MPKIPLKKGYVNLVCSTLHAALQNYDLTSLAIYGSVARGNAHSDSDLDLLLVFNDFRGSHRNLKMNRIAKSYLSQAKPRVEDADIFY